MKSSYLFLALFFFLGTSTVFAQLPEKAEDVSPLLNGEIMPDLQLTNIEGKKVSFLSEVKDKPSVVIFYRGGWCPYCNQHLAELGQREQEMLDKGFQVIAISPDAINGLSKTIDKNELKYTLLSDASGDFSKAVGIAFKAPERYGKRLFQVSDGENKGFLPVPAVFVLDKEGTILFEYINPNYKTRMSADLLMAVLDNLEVE